MRRTTLTIEQVRMILRIYWTDRYQRQAIGLQHSTPGIRPRLAKTFKVSIEVIKKIVGMKPTDHGAKRRARFPSIAVQSIKRSAKLRLRQRHGEINVRTGKSDHAGSRRGAPAAPGPEQADAGDGGL